MRLLIAEDDRATAALLSGLTRFWGYDVVVAHDGAAALKTITDEQTPRLVLLDWMMPGLDGPEVCRRLRALHSTAPTYIILLTSRSGHADVIEGLEAGADEYLAKPFHNDELRARLNAGARIVDLQQRLASQITELEGALANVRQLTGLLPICAYCKSIRDDSNYWQSVEEYVGDHSGATFSHGICPNCLNKVNEELDTQISGQQRS